MPEIVKIGDKDTELFSADELFEKSRAELLSLSEGDQRFHLWSKEVLLENLEKDYLRIKSLLQRFDTSIIELRFHEYFEGGAVLLIHVGESTLVIEGYAIYDDGASISIDGENIPHLGK